MLTSLNQQLIYKEGLGCGLLMLTAETNFLCYASIYYYAVQKMMLLGISSILNYDNFHIFPKSIVLNELNF